MGDESNDYHKELIRPNTEELLNISAGNFILDVGCGNGNFSRRLSELGAKVTAFDYSDELIKHAKNRTSDEDHNIEYKVMDGTNFEELTSIGEKCYDAAVANMVLMDMGEIEPLIKGLNHLLKVGGTFVFSQTHPCFQAPDSYRVKTRKNDEKNAPEDGILISRYIESEVFEGDSIRVQPTKSIFFHRSLTTLFETFFHNGFVLDGLIEPTFHKSNTKRVNWIQLPPVIIVRMKKT